MNRVNRYRVMIINRIAAWRPAGLFEIPTQGEIVEVGEPCGLREAEGFAVGFNAAAVEKPGLWAVICCAPYGAPIPRFHRPKSLVRNARNNKRKTV